MAVIGMMVCAHKLDDRASSRCQGVPGRWPHRHAEEPLRFFDARAARKLSSINPETISARTSPALQIIAAIARKYSCRGTRPKTIRNAAPGSSPNAYHRKYTWAYTRPQVSVLTFPVLIVERHHRQVPWDGIVQQTRGYRCGHTKCLTAAGAVIKARGSMLGISLCAAVSREGQHRIGFGRAALHARRPHRHARNREAYHIRFLIEEA